MSTDSAQVTDPSAFTEGSLAIQVVLFVVTFGLYGIYWLYTVNTQLAAGTNAEFDPMKRTLLTVVLGPFLIGLLWLWKTSSDAEAVAGTGGPIVFVLFLVFAPAAWYLIQSGVNDVAAGA